MNGRREGFTIVEVVVAMVMLMVIGTMMAGLTFSAARQAVRNSDASTLNAASLALVNRLSALPFDRLSGAAGCDTVGTGNARFEGCVTVQTVKMGANVSVATRALQRGQNVPATTVTFMRVAPVPANPLCVGC